MKNLWWLSVLLLLMSANSFAQTRLFSNQPDSEKDSPEKSKKEEKSSIEDYKIISFKGDTTYVDTTLTIQKDYLFNYIRKDNFGLLPFSNVGQSYAELTKSFKKYSTLPEFGARATHFAFLEVDDIHYYNVPTPWSQLFFKTTFQQGQLLDAFITTNVSPQVNLSIAYKGLHSMGKYRHDMTSQGSFRATLSYKTKKERYQIHSHFVHQNLEAEQNGGLTDQANQQFASQSNQYSDRGVLDNKYNDGDRKLLAKRFFVHQYFNLIPGDENANNEVRLSHTLNFTDKEYYFSQTAPYEGYGISYQNNNLRDLTEFQEVSNTVSARYQNNLLGSFLFKARHVNYNYGYKRRLNLDSGVIPNRLKGDVISLGAEYEKKIGGFMLSGDAMINTVGDFDGNYIRAKASYDFDEENSVEAGLHTNSAKPNYNFLLYQSDYKNYNWRNDFKNVQKQHLYFTLKSEKIADLKVDYTRIHNYTYFGLKANTIPEILADSLVTPFQHSSDVNYVRVQAHKELNWRKFSLDNTVLYQKVLEGEEVFRVSDFVIRNSFYFKDYWFDRNLYLQTGITFNYFTGYRADAYDPVLGEFYVQDFEKMKGFSRLDFFFNARVRQTRLFFKVENFTTLLDENGHYAAPYQPYRDWNIRFGLVWDFFM